MAGLGGRDGTGRDGVCVGSGRSAYGSLAMSWSEEHVVGVGHIRQPVGMQRHLHAKPNHTSHMLIDQWDVCGPVPSYPAAESVVHGDVGVFVVVPPLLGRRDGAVRAGRVVAVTTTHAATIPARDNEQLSAMDMGHGPIVDWLTF